MNVSFISLGCDKNRVNTEQMMALCLQAGITVQEDCPGSDVVVINTCGFIDSAKSEAIDTILSAAQLKEEGQIGKILVTGCLSQRYQADILEELPEIDGIMGTGCFGDIVPALEQVMEGRECRHFADINGPVEELPRVLSTPRHYAYLRIAEGCSNRCAYCVIPSLRGNYRSRRMEDILAEARALAEDGVRECIVIAQDITRYGIDLYGEKKLAALLRELCKLDFRWIRLHYLYPDEFTDELIDTIAAEEKVLPYLDIPIQHCNDRVLKAMNRHYTREEYLKLAHYGREIMPELVLTSDVIVGFPGETEEEFEDTLSLIEEVRYDALFTFIFSPRAGTPAAKMDDPTPKEEKNRRFDRLCDTQNRISLEIHQGYVGRTLRVLVDGREKEMLTARTEGGRLVRFAGDDSLIGQFLDVTITGCTTWSLVGEVK